MSYVSSTGTSITLLSQVNSKVIWPMDAHFTSFEESVSLRKNEYEFGISLLYISTFIINCDFVFSTYYTSPLGTKFELNELRISYFTI